MLKNRDEAYELLRSLGAPDRVLGHAGLVEAVADELMQEFQALGLPCDRLTIELGAILHDAGKTVHPEELAMPGSLHEQAGEALLLWHGVQPEVASCCVSHGAWNLPGVTLEERTVALADKLWKGKREADLELAVIDEVSARLGVSRWDVFERLDTVFEQISDGGDERLRGSRLD